MRRTFIAVAAITVMSTADPVQAQVCTPFTDVAASDTFCSNIQWMFNRGVTLGCNAPGQPAAYCPSQFVRRDQMAAFMNRLADEAVFQQGGNAFGTAGELGTTDNQALDIIVNNSRVMRYEPNAISPNVIGGSPANDVNPGVRGATIGGGGATTNTDPAFAGEARNHVTDAYGTVGGGLANRAGDGVGTTFDRAFATVGGGFTNTASSEASTVGGGISNTASGPYSTVAGGANNRASNNWSTVAGGDNNVASGPLSTVAGGRDNTASGNFSFAAGYRANANDTGCFVWGDVSTNNDVECAGPNKFVVRSLGGIYFFSLGNSNATYNGAYLAPGDTGWTIASDRRIKENLHTVDTRDVLDKVLALPIATWNLKSQDASIRHMGAMAQDFRAAFGLGDSELGINTIDADGVALAAIQGLNAKVEAQQREIADLRSTVEQLLAQQRASR